MAPPLVRQDSIIRIKLYAKVRHAPPLELGHTNGQNLCEDFYFGPKIGLNLSEEQLIGLHLILGVKPD